MGAFGVVELQGAGEGFEDGRVKIIEEHEASPSRVASAVTA